MIIVNLIGGLGNQMFQYAVGRKLSLKNNTQLKLDTRGYKPKSSTVLDKVLKNDVYREYSLSTFNIQAGIATAEESDKLKNPAGVVTKLARKIYRKISGNHWIGFYPRVLTWSGDMYLNGYWQSPKYFEDIRDILLKDFTLKQPLENKVPDLVAHMKNSESVSVHVRRGDTVTDPVANKCFFPCSIAYYSNAISYLKEKIGKDVQLFIFSDDPTWTEEHLELPHDAVIVSKAFKLTDYEEVVAMSYCKHNIIANSTFSWWGAWLNQNPHKIVIAPTPWTNTKQRHYKHIIPSSWIRLPKNP